MVVGERAVLQCNTDLDAVAVEWLYGGEVVVRSSAHSAELQFDPVNDSIHDRQYTCRVISPYGIQERNTTVTVTGKCEVHFIQLSKMFSIPFIILANILVSL